MIDSEVHIIGDEDIVLMLGLIGIQGTIVENQEEFLKTFNRVINQSKLEMVIVSIQMSDEIIEFLMEFKLNNRRPFVFILPDVFRPNIEKDDPLLSKIFEAISDIVLL
ncbi:MAG: V-type ATP synthase subunit F [Promethearchaeota archaeon]|jgi:vacuolar-type H+-ATPase subunit F/Vma7